MQFLDRNWNVNLNVLTLLSWELTVYSSKKMYKLQIIYAWHCGKIIYYNRLLERRLKWNYKNSSSISYP